MEHEKYTYPEALRFLANKYQIEIEEEKRTDEDIQKQSERESQLIVLAYAQQYFTDILMKGGEGRAIGFTYFKERGFADDTIEKFQLGYCTEAWDGFTKAALEKGYQEEYLEKTGLTIVKDKRSFDRFRGRVMFPIHNFSGRVIGFGGRILKSNAKAAKYVNSPESEIYEKRKVLYGIYYAKKSIISKDNCLLVEGYTDVISLHQSGIENVVSSSGTSLTEDQIRLIKRITNNITILFDGDAAGIKASFRSIDLILEEGMNVKVVLFPEGADPDSYAKSVTPDELASFIDKNAKDFISFKADLLMQETAGDPVKKASIIKDIIASVAVMPDAIVRSMYVRECSKVMDIAEQVLFAELNKVRRKSFSSKSVGQSSFGMQDQQVHPAGLAGYPQVDAELQNECNNDPQERDVIRVLLNYGDMVFALERPNGQEEEESVTEYEESVAGFIVNEVMADRIAFENPVYQLVYNAFEQGLDNGNLPRQQFFLQHENQEISALSVDLIFTPHNLSHNWEEKHHIFVQTEKEKLKNLVERTVYSLKMAKIKKMLQENREKIKAVNDEKGRDKLLRQYHNLLEAKKSISKYLGRVLG
jgi:DNA primase